MSPELPAGPGQQMSTTEFITTMAHFHRAEIARMAGWRDRLDRTTNWAITVAAALLSVSLSTPTAHHGVLLFAMLLVPLLLWIEARRYRFFVVYRSRVRQIERHYFAQAFSPEKDFAANWLAILGQGLRSPDFLISYRQAFARRLRRNYIYMFSILLLAWVVKLTTPSLQQHQPVQGFLNSVLQAVASASLGPFPGWLIVTSVAIFYAALFAIALLGDRDSGELAYGGAHV